MAETAGSMTVMIGLDETESSLAALREVLGVFSGDAKPMLIIVHVLVQRIPPHLEYVDPSMVWDTAGLPPAMESADRAQLAEHKASITKRLQAILDAESGGSWPADRMRIDVVEGGFSRATIAEIMTYQARETNADIVVVGRTRHGAFHDAFIKSTAQRLIKGCQATSIWVVSSTPCDEDDAKG